MVREYFCRAAAMVIAGGFLAACGGGASERGAWGEVGRPVFTEVVSIGSGSGDTLRQFGQIVSADIGSGGVIYVLDQQTQIVSAFDTTGVFLRRIGKRGSGPGEVRLANNLFAGAGDTLLLVDLGSQSLVRLGADGEEFGSVRLDISEGVPIKWMERPDGSLLVQLRALDLEAMGAAMAGRPGAAGRAMSAPVDYLVVRNSIGEVSDTLMTLPGGETFQAGGERGLTFRLFSPEPMWTLGESGRVYHGVNSEYSITVRDAGGGVLHTVQRSVPRRKVTEGVKAAMREVVRKQMEASGAPAAMLDDMLSMMEFAEYLPAFGNIMGGPAATLWVERPVTAEEIETLNLSGGMQTFGTGVWDVFDSTGAYLGDMELSREFTPLRWVGNRLLGVRNDAADVPHLVVLRLDGLAG